MSSGGGQQQGQGKGGQQQGQGKGGGKLEIYAKLGKNDIGFKNPNPSLYIDLLDKRYNNEDIKATIVLFRDKEKGDKLLTGKEEQETILEQSFAEIAFAASKGSDEIKKKYEGIYFRIININMQFKDEKQGEKQGENKGKNKLLDGLIDTVNNKRSFLRWFYNKPRWDPYNPKIVEAEENLEKTNAEYKFTIDIDGKIKNKYPFIVVYYGTLPKAFYEGPFGYANPKDKDTDDFKKQKLIVQSILDNFIREIAIRDEFRYDNQRVLDDVRRQQWKNFNDEISGPTVEAVNVFNYFKLASRGYDNARKALIPAIPSFIIPEITETTNMLGQKFNTNDPEKNDLIIFVPEFLPIPKREFKQGETEQERKAIQEEKQKFQQEVNEIKEENKKIQIDEIYMPAIPAFYLNEKGQPVYLKKR